MYRVSCRLCCIEIGIDSQFIATITIFVISPRTVAQHLGQQPCRFPIESKKRKKKVKEADLYSAFIELAYLTLKALRYGSHSITCKLHRTCLYFAQQN